MQCVPGGQITDDRHAPGERGQSTKHIRHRCRLADGDIEGGAKEECNIAGDDEDGRPDREIAIKNQCHHQSRSAEFVTEGVNDFAKLGYLIEFAG